MRWLAVTMLLFSCIAASSEPYPSKPIKLIVPFPPGGTTDLLARILAERLPAVLGQPVVVENRAGAGGMLGTEALARSAADGHTIGMATASTHGINPAVQKKISYDAIKDFAPVSRIASVPNVMTVHPSVSAKTISEFVALARRDPGKLSFASPGSGSVGHMMGELFKSAAQVDMLHVPYKGAGPALNDAIGGQVQVLYDNLPTSLPHIQAGKLRPLAIASEKRSLALPDVPTFAEMNLRAVNEPAWFGIVVPSATPRAIIDRLHSAIENVMKQVDVRARFEKVGAEPIHDSPAKFSQHIAKEIADYRAVAQKAGITIE
ncbi:MAG: Bug family tripartite tricarboxylate transporter substrate binding protein [Casimicrobium sp.]